MKPKKTLYWFTNDLRIHDNPVLSKVAEDTDTLLCVYVIDPAWFKPNRYGTKPMGEHRWNFLRESLINHDQSLNALGQKLIVLQENPLQALQLLITLYDPERIIRSENAGFYENKQWQLLAKRYPFLQFEEVVSHTIFEQGDLPFDLSELPKSFTPFRKKVELLSEYSMATTNSLPPMPSGLKIESLELGEKSNRGNQSNFKGGEQFALRHLDDYFNSELPSHYKEVRNALDGWENSTKFSAWLANGSLSVKKLLLAINEYESAVEANESTYWIKFELLWREYFQWYAHVYGASLFLAKGTSNKSKLNSFYPERFQRWCEGNTPYPLVNACMKQLNATGYMSNRGRQIVASCLVNELGLDWRYGAAYFEQQLIDYDVASNWGNWQYIAGVGADPRGGRHFYIEKQTEQYDPEKKFIQNWQGDNADGKIDSVDAADWPIE